MFNNFERDLELALAASLQTFELQEKKKAEEKSLIEIAKEESLKTEQIRKDKLLAINLAKGFSQDYKPVSKPVSNPVYDSEMQKAIAELKKRKPFANSIIPCEVKTRHNNGTVGNQSNKCMIISIKHQMEYNYIQAPSVEELISRFFRGMGQNNEFDLDVHLHSDGLYKLLNQFNLGLIVYDAVRIGDRAVIDVGTPRFNYQKSNNIALLHIANFPGHFESIIM